MGATVKEIRMPIKSYNFGSDGVQKTQKWTQEQIDAVERAKEQQRQREQEANRQRDTNSQNSQANSPR
jgi:hypothetical protein